MFLPVFLTGSMPWPCVYLCFWKVEWLGHVFTCVSDKLSDLAMCLAEFLTSWVTWRCVYLCFWQVKRLFTCVSDKLSYLAMCLPVFLTSWVTWPCVYLCFWQVEWLGHVITCVSDKLSDLAMFTCVSDKLSDLASSFLSWPTTYWFFSNACSSLSSWEGENAVRILFGFRNGSRNSGRCGPGTENWE